VYALADFQVNMRQRCYFLVYLNAKSDFYLKINDTISEIFILFETPVAS